MYNILYNTYNLTFVYDLIWFKSILEEILDVDYLN